MSSSPAAKAAKALHGDAIIREIKASGVKFVVSVPDIVTSEGLLRPLASDPDLTLIRVCQEAEGYGICAGLSYADQRGLILIQHTGLLDSINALRSPAVEYELPICLMVGLLGKQPEVAPRDARALGVRIIEPILDAMGVDHCTVNDDDDLALIVPAIENAYARSRPVVILLGRGPIVS